MTDRTHPPGVTAYAAFWPVYLGAHRKAATRRWHFLGTGLGLGCLATALLLWDWRPLVTAPVVGYALAWLSHILVEGNRPATFGHPLWSLFSDFRMFALWLSGGLDRELARHGIAPGR